LDAARRGTLRFTRGIVRRGEVRLLAGETALPSLIEAFIPPETDDEETEGDPLHAVVDGLSLEDITLTGGLLGLEGIDIPKLRVDGRLETNAEGYLEIEVHRAFGTLTEPYPFLGHIDRLSARIHTDPLEGLVLRTTGRVERQEGPTDHVRVRVTYRVPDGGDRDDPQELDVLVEADPAEARILSELGYDWADLFDSRIEGSFRLQGNPDDTLAMTVDVETEGGRAELTGTLGPDGEVRIEGNTEELSLADFVAGAPDLRVRGHASMEIDGEDPDAPPRIAIELEPLTYEGWAVPALRGEGVLLEDSVRIDRVTAPYAGGTIRGSGEVDFDGSARLRIRGRIPDLARDRNARRVMPGIAGAATIDARLETFGPDRPDLDFSGTITLTDVVYGELRASTLRLSGSARGNLAHPRVRLAVDGQGLSIAGYPLGTTDVTLHGGPSVYNGSGTFRTGDGRALELAAAASRRGDEWSLDVERLEYRYGGETWTGQARRVVLDPDRFIEIDGAALTNGSQRLEGWGTVRFRGEDHLEALLQDFDLAALRALVGDAVPDVGGRADAHVRLEGDLLRPKLLIQGALRNGHLTDVENVNASYLIEYAEGNLSYDASLDLGDRGNLSMVGTGILDADIPNPFDALEGGIYDVRLAVNGLDLGVVQHLTDTALPDDVEGHLQGTLHAAGPIFAPDLEMDLGVYRFVVPGITPLNIQTALTYESGALVGHVSVA
ncbi:MAG: hypothetical protein JRH11_27235, partial [Deltaproteobacteria bacterium]|nr:hypothetical protein [Deltaproteobacteria bacterium]